MLLGTEHLIFEVFQDKVLEDLCIYLLQWKKDFKKCLLMLQTEEGRDRKKHQCKIEALSGYLPYAP